LALAAAGPVDLGVGGRVAAFWPPGAWLLPGW
jgi:hypothetical protein